MHQPMGTGDEIDELEEALNKFAAYCYDLLCASKLGMDGFHDGVRHVVKKYTEVIQPVLIKRSRTLH